MSGPGIEQITAEPQVRLNFGDTQAIQRFAAMRLTGDPQLMTGQVRQLGAEAVMAAGAEPVRRVLAIVDGWAQVEFDGQFQMMIAVTVAQQQVEFTQGAPAVADCQVGRQQLDAWRVLQGELPKAFVVQAQPPTVQACQPPQQRRGRLVERREPVAKALRIIGPGAAQQRVALGAAGLGQQRWRQQRPGQVAHGRVAQLAGQGLEIGEGHHPASIAGLPLAGPFAHNPGIVTPAAELCRSTMEQFRNIGIIGRLGSSQVLDTIRRLKKFLLERHLHVILEDTIAEVLPGHGLQTSTRKLLGEVCDLVIVVGGDGSLLGAARALARHNIPVLGINRGNLGFLTDIRPDELEEKVAEVLDGHYLVENRFLLQAEVRRHHEAIGQGDALNDVVLHPGKSTRMIEFEIYIDGQFVCSQKADGLIVATPTGSTAYALSAGGPIMHPKLDAIVIVPMYPHTLSGRPIVVDGNSELKIVVSKDLQIYPQVSCDGQNHFTCAPGDTITVSKKPQKLRLIHPLDHNYYEVCRTKLGWGSRLGGRDD